MKKLLSILAFALTASSAQAADFTVTSPDFLTDRAIAPVHVYKGFGCEGGNLSPTLSWSGAPEGTKSYAVTVYDPDAPTGSGWWHWVVYNLPATTATLPQGASSIPNGLPKEAVQGHTDYGTVGYGGPCPPQGDKPHHYITTVYALNVEKLDLPVDATAALIGFNLNANALAKATLTATYGR